MIKKEDIHNPDLIKELSNEFEEIKRNISSLRKRGIITKTVEYMIANIPAKIKMASITNRKKDVDRIHSVFNKVLAELDFLEKEYLSEQKKLNYILNLLHKANDLLAKHQLKECLPVYYEIRNFYKALSLESKYKVLDSCIKFYSEFQRLAKI